MAIVGSTRRRNEWPRGPLAVDWSYPLAHTLRVLVWDMRPGLQKVRNLVRHNSAEFTDTGVPGVVVGPYGQAGDFSTGNVLYGDTGWSSGLGYGALSIMAHIRRSSATGYSGICGFGGFAPGMYESTAAGPWGAYAGGQRPANTTLSAGNWHTVCCVFSAGNNISFYLDGEADGTSTSSGAFGTGFRIGYEGFAYGSMAITWLGVWGSALPVDVIQALHYEPQQLLRADVRRTWFLPAAAGGSSIAAISAYYHRMRAA